MPPSAAAFALLALAAAGTEFPAGHLLLTNAGNGAVLEFDRFGNKVASHPIGGPANGIAIGPDGRAFVVQPSGSLTAFDRAGTLDVIAVPGTPMSIAIGAQGRRFIALDDFDQVVVKHPAGLTLDAFFESDGQVLAPKGLAFGPDGDLWVAATSTDKLVAHDGLDARSHAVSLGDPWDLAFARDGYAFASRTDLDRIELFTPSFASQGGLSHPDLVDPKGVALNADGVLFAVATTRVVRFSSFSDGGASATSFTDVELASPSDLAFVPWRFRVTVSGTFYSSLSNQTSAVKQHAVVSFLPSSMQALLHFLPAPVAKSPLSYAFGGEHVFFGLEQDAAGGKAIAFHGTEPGARMSTDADGSIALTVKPKRAKDGAIVKLSGLAGTVTFAASGSVFTGKLGGAKLLNGGGS